MIDLDENKKNIKEFKEELEKIYITLNIEEKTSKLKDLENKTLEENFWTNNTN